MLFHFCSGREVQYSSRAMCTALSSGHLHSDGQSNRLVLPPPGHAHEGTATLDIEQGGEALTAAVAGV